MTTTYDSPSRSEGGDRILWPPLTATLDDRRSPVRAFLDQRFPHSRDVQAHYRNTAGELLVEGSGANPGTLGCAFDWMVRFLVCPEPDLHLAMLGATHMPNLGTALPDLASSLGTNLTEQVTRFAGPLAGTRIDQELLVRGCWALALLTELYRAGLRPDSPLAQLTARSVSPDQLLTLVPPGALTELGELRRHAERVLLPALAARDGAWAIGPTFMGSRIMKADADLVAAGLLVELKTNLGDKRRDGMRRSSLSRNTLLQLIGYMLLDFSDELQIREVGVYDARYAHLVTWPLDELLHELAGRPVEVAEERKAFELLLRRGHRSHMLDDETAKP